MMHPDGGDSIENALPREVVELGLDPVVALLTTLYIFYMGKIVGQEMAATAGFPAFPAGSDARRDLIRRGLEHDLDPELALDLIAALERDLRAAPPADAARETPAAEGRLLAAAILNQGERTAAQSKKLSKILSVISANAERRDDMEFWTPGLRAIGKLTRLMIEAVLPTRIGTMANLADPDSGLRQISTLGGALFLGHSIGVLTKEGSANPQSPYAVLGGRISDLTSDMGGQRVKVPSPEAVEQYIRDVQAFARRGESSFAVEHPFHFRVLLEVLSDENRRYPAEPVLNVAALRRILPSPPSSPPFWAHVIWSRQQLPVVGNLVRLPERQRADAYIQHYAAFGRTPHTSSFTHLDYEVRSPVGDDSVLAAWPDAFQRKHRIDLLNTPNSVCQVFQALDRERSLGRLWRGTPEEGDLRWLCGQVMEWDGRRESERALVDRIWRSDRWTGQVFPAAAMAEVRVGAWLLEALRLRLAAAVPPTAAGGGQLYLGQSHADDREHRATKELRCVLEIMALFCADYLAGDDDGLPGLQRTLRQLRDSDWFTELGPRMSTKLDQLEGHLETLRRQLDAEVHLAGDALREAET